MFTTHPPYSTEYGGASVPPPAGSILAGARPTIFMRSNSAQKSLTVEVRRGIVDRLDHVAPLVPPVAGRAEATGRLEVPVPVRCFRNRKADDLVAASGIHPKPCA